LIDHGGDGCSIHVGRVDGAAECDGKLHGFKKRWANYHE
jgi:hypothetical protein